VGLTHVLGGKITRTGLKEVNNVVKATLGKDLAKMAGTELQRVAEFLGAQGIEMGVDGVVKDVGGQLKPSRPKAK